MKTKLLALTTVLLANCGPTDVGPPPVGTTPPPPRALATVRLSEVGGSTMKSGAGMDQDAVFTVIYEVAGGTVEIGSVSGTLRVDSASRPFTAQVVNARNVRLDPGTHSVQYHIPAPEPGPGGVYTVDKRLGRAACDRSVNVTAEVVIIHNGVGGRSTVVGGLDPSPCNQFLFRTRAIPRHAIEVARPRGGL